MRVAWWLVLSAVLANGTALAAPQWQALPEAPAGSRIDGLHFVDANHGWTCGADGRVFRTADGGASWENLKDYSDPYLRAITFADLQHGWIGTLSSDSLLYQTTNGGETWTRVTNIPQPRPIAICGLWAPSSQVIYGVGAYSGPARMIKSIDGGATWISTDFSPLASTVIDVYFKNTLEGFVVGSVGVFPDGNSAVVLHTTDGGATWQRRFLGTRLGEWGWKISFPTPLVGYVSLERRSGPMFFLKTEDGGLTWSDHAFPLFNEQGIGFATPEVGWIGGKFNPTFVTTNGGASWTPSPWGNNLNRFQFLSPTLGFASGERIYKYSDPLAGVPPSGPPRLRPVAAPNPFAENTTIRFTLEQAERVEILIVDPSGRLVRRLENTERGTGPHVVTWDGLDDERTPAPPGFYLYVLHAGEQHAMGRLVRVR